MLNKTIFLASMLISFTGCKLAANSSVGQSHKSPTEVEARNADAIYKKNLRLAGSNEGKVLGVLLSGRASNLNISNTLVEKQRNDAIDKAYSDRESSVVVAIMVPAIALTSAGVLVPTYLSAAGASTVYGASTVLYTAMLDRSTKADADYSSLVNKQQEEVFALKSTIRAVVEGDQSMRQNAWSAIKDYTRQYLDGIDISKEISDEKIGFFYLLKAVNPKQ